MSWDSRDVIREAGFSARGRKFRRPSRRDGKLDVWFGKIDGDGPDMCVQSGNGCGGSSTRGYVLGLFCNKQVYAGSPGWADAFLEEMDKRGFDVSTLRFSISLKNVNQEPTR
jgi:hypothetical protein